MLTGKGTELLITGTSRLFKVNKTWARSFLRDMVDAIGMTTIFGPQVEVITEDKLTGFIILAESHASIHWVKPTLYLDLFSCKEFEVDSVVLWVSNEWQIDAGYYQVFERGWGPDLNPDVSKYPMPNLSKTFLYT